MVRADLHIHTVLSPCGDVDMSPKLIVERAKQMGIQVLGVSDHNSTRQCEVVRSVGASEGIYVLCGAEITTKEEVHVLVFVESGKPLTALQQFIDESLPEIPNNPDFFGYQLVVDEHENVLVQEERLLISALDKTIDEVGEFIRSVGGIFIPAHIDKPRDSILAQLGFVPPSLRVDALELSPRCDKEALLKQHPYLSKYNLIRGSDAHYLEEIGRMPQQLDIKREVTFGAIKEAIGRVGTL